MVSPFCISKGSTTSSEIKHQLRGHLSHNWIKTPIQNFHIKIFFVTQVSQCSLHPRHPITQCRTFVQMEAPGEPRPEESNMATIDHSVHSLLRGRKKYWTTFIMELKVLCSELPFQQFLVAFARLSFHILSTSSPWNKQPLMFLNEILNNQSHLRLCEDRFRSSKVPVIGFLRLPQKTDCYGAGRNKIGHMFQKKWETWKYSPFSNPSIW